VRCLPVAVVIGACLSVAACTTKTEAGTGAWPDSALENVYKATGNEPQALEYVPHEEEVENSQPRIVIRVDAFGHNGYSTGHGPKGAATFNNYDGGRLYFEDGTTLDVTKLTLEGWSGEPPAVAKGTPIRGSK